MIVATCSVCGEVFRSRTRPNSIRKIGKHWRKEHPEALSRRIKEGKRTSLDNPTVQDFIVALREAPGRALDAYAELRKKDWIQLKKVMDAMEPFLPEDMKVSWKFVEAVHDRATR